MVQVLGALLDGKTMSATWGTNVVNERWLVKMSSPLNDVSDVQSQLPAYGATAEPTFTIGISYHPKLTNLKLKSLNSLSPSPEGQPYWIVDVTYETPQWMKEASGPDKRLDANGNPIIRPWDEPPTWSSSTRTVRQTNFKDASGNLLVHANDLPLTEGIEAEIQLEVHQFTWNVPYDTFNYTTDVRPFQYRVNSNTLYGSPAGFVLLETLTASEAYRSTTVSVPDGVTPPAQILFHYITLNATFVIDAYGNARGISYFAEQQRRVSMHTAQKVAIPLTVPQAYGYAPIPVNARGDFAEAPWPLLSATAATTRGLPFGAAAPYTEMGSLDPLADFHYIDTGLPLTANLTGFVNTHGLVIP